MQISLKKNAGFPLCNKLFVKTRWKVSSCIVLFENVIKTYPFHNVHVTLKLRILAWASMEPMLFKVHILLHSKKKISIELKLKNLVQSNIVILKHCDAINCMAVPGSCKKL